MTYVPVIASHIFSCQLALYTMKCFSTISITFLLQGFLNTVVNLHPRWIKAREQRSQLRFVLFKSALVRGTVSEDKEEEEEDSTSPMELLEPEEHASRPRLDWISAFDDERKSSDQRYAPLPNK